MIETTKRKTGRGHGAVSITLFLGLFAGQAAMIAMSPVLANAAGDLHVSTAAAGQLRTIAGLAAGITALTLAAVAGRVGVGRQLLIASALLALGSITSAAAPTFALLALAQLPVGVAAAVLTTAGTLAAAEWVSPEQRTHVLSWALLGQPAAWIVGMPVIGLLGEHSWRYGWLALPLVAAVAAGLLVAPRPRQPTARTQPARARAVLGDPALVRWLASEVLANAAWAGTLVYAGALFAESYGASTKLTGCLLALAACAYIAGNLTCRRLLGREPRRVLVLTRRPPRRRRHPLRNCAFGRRYEHCPSLRRCIPRRRPHADLRRVRTHHASRLAAGRDQPPSRDDAVRLLRRLDRRRCGARRQRLQRARSDHGPPLPRGRNDARPPPTRAPAERRTPGRVAATGAHPHA